jgi:phosphatidylglycerophosphate synthase
MPESSHYNIFTAQEAPYQRQFQHWRERAFAPFLRLCHWLGLTPFTLSLLSLVSMFLLPLGLTQSSLFIPLAFGLHIFFDGMDGALARHLGQASARGSYIDIVVDHLALIVTVLTLQWFAIGNPFWMMLYACTYLLLIVHLLILNVRGSVPIIPVIRSRYLMFGVVCLHLLGGLSLEHLDLFFQIAGLYHAGIMFAYFFLLGWSLPS